MFDFLKRLFNVKFASAPLITAPSSVKSKSSTHKLSYNEKELLAVKRTTQQDVLQLTGFPYSWNSPIQKSIEPHGHPFVYMDIVGENLAIAKSELVKINAYIERDKKLSPALKKLTCLPISEITFKRSAKTGYSRLMLSPVTYNGKPSKYPVALFFMSDPWSSNYHGTIFYGQDGSIQKAEIFIGHGGIFLYYEAFEGDLILARVENACREIIYKGKLLLDFEASLARTEEDYAWLQANLPEKCPKSITSYRRMRTQNTTNYQALKALAAAQGREI